ncbi:hypothetical protein KAI87_00785 [Myxococcota bacterium]|nr:hypothetical protein [Myxococcota bacterium]
MDSRISSLGLILSLLLPSLFFGGCTLSGGVDAPEIDATHRLTLLYSGNFQGRLCSSTDDLTQVEELCGLDSAHAPFGGAARFSFLVERERKRSQASLFLDAGGALSEVAPEFQQSLDTQMAFFESLHPAAMTLEPGDLRILKHLGNQSVDQYSSLPLVISNCLPAQGADSAEATTVASSLIVGANGLRVGVLGAVSPTLCEMIYPESGMLSAAIGRENIRREAVSLHPVVDLIILLSSLGPDEDGDLIEGHFDMLSGADANLEGAPDEEEMIWIDGMRQIDVVIGRSFFPQGSPRYLKDMDARMVPALYAGRQGRFLGRFDILLRRDFEQGGALIESSRNFLFAVDSRLDGIVDPALSRWLNDSAIECESDDLPLAYVPQTLRSERYGRYYETGVGNFVADTLLSYGSGEVDGILLPGPLLGGSLHAGELGQAELMQILNWDPGLIQIDLSVSDLRALLLKAALLEEPSGVPQVHLSGFTMQLEAGEEGLNADFYQNGTRLDDHLVLRLLIADDWGSKQNELKDILASGSSFKGGERLSEHLLFAISARPHCSEIEKISQAGKDKLPWCEDQTIASQRICSKVGSAGRIPSQAACGEFADWPCVSVQDYGRIFWVSTDGEAL